MTTPQFRLSTDSNCDVPFTYLAEHNVQVTRMPYLLDGVEYLDDSWEKSSPDEFYEKLRAGAECTTVQSTIPDLLDLFNSAVKEELPTVHLCFSSALSGTYETTDRIAAQVVAENPGSSIDVVDTKDISIVQYLIIVKAIELRDSGMSREDFIAWAEEAHNFAFGYFALDELEHLRRGGRIPDMAALAGSKLDIKPILTISEEGVLGFEKATRGRKKAIRTLIERYKSDCENETIERPDFVVIGHADTLDEAHKIEEMLREVNPQVKVTYCRIGIVVTSHVGPSIIAIAYWSTDKRKSSSGLFGRRSKG